MYTKNISVDLRHRYAWVCKLIDACQKSIAKYPEGRLRIYRRGENIFYYHVTDNKKPNGKIIDKNDHALAEALAQKTYLETILKIALIEQQILQSAIKEYPERKLENVYESYSQDRKSLVHPFALPDDEFVQAWTAKPYKPKGFKEGLPVYTTMRGERVRSKSEQLIADRLYVNGIPYKYECPITLDGITFHPDFTILRLSDRKEIYYEHLGRMDDPNYAEENVYKLNTCARNGLIMGNNLYATFETRNQPLDVSIVEMLIREEFR